VRCSNCSAARSRKNSMLSRRSMSFIPAATKHSNSPERISGPSLFCLAPLLGILVAVAIALNAINGKVEQISS
jgi:hypothetical protein